MKITARHLTPAQAAAGTADPDIMAAIAEAAEPLVRYVAHRWQLPGMTDEDLRQEARLAIIETAIPRWAEQPADADGFAPFAVAVMKNHLRTLRTLITAEKRQPTQPVQPLTACTATPARTATNPARIVEQREAIDRLRDRIAQAGGPTLAAAVPLLMAGYSQAEAAERIAASPGALKQAVSRARNRLGLPRVGSRPVEQLDATTYQVIRRYRSVDAAGRAAGTAPSNITAAIKRRGTAGGWRWRYASGSGKNPLRQA